MNINIAFNDNERNIFNIEFTNPGDSTILTMENRKLVKIWQLAS